MLEKTQQPATPEEILIRGFDRLNPFFPNGFDRAKLAAIIDKEMSAQSPHYHAEKLSRSNLHMIDKSLSRVITLLAKPRNWSVAVSAISDDKTLGAYLQAEQRYISLLADLRKISAVTRAPKRARNRPNRTKDLEAFVDRLASYWENETGQPFTQSWQKKNSKKNKEQKTPMGRTTWFVYDVVDLVFPWQLHLLPKVTERVVKKRRAAISRK